MATKLTAKQEKFCLNIIQGMTQHDAYTHAYSTGNMLPATIDQCACVLSSDQKIATRIAELRAEAASDKVMTVIERKERLSEIARAKLTDFIDNDEPVISDDIPNNTAASEFVHKTTYTKSGDHVVTKAIKLRDPIAAINELNKMERIYSDAPSINIVNQITTVEIVKDYGSRLPYVETKDTETKQLDNGKTP